MISFYLVWEVCQIRFPSVLCHWSTDMDMEHFNDNGKNSELVILVGANYVGNFVPSTTEVQAMQSSFSITFFKKQGL